MWNLNRLSRLEPTWRLAKSLKRNSVNARLDQRDCYTNPLFSWWSDSARTELVKDLAEGLTAKR